MEQTKSACVVLVAVFLLFIFAEPAVQVISDIRSGQSPTALDVFKRAPSPSNLRAYEDGLREQSVVANAVRPWLQYWRFEVMDDAGKNGLTGREGWLFYRPGVQFLVEPWPGTKEVEEPLRAITSFRDQLKARGTELLIVITPGKESVYPNRLTRRATGAVNGHVTAFIDTLKKNGIEVVYADAAEDSGGESAYLAQDTHWTPSHARDVAQRVAGFAIDQGWIQKGTAIYDERATTIERHGDILRMAKSAPLLDDYAPEKITCWQVVDHATGEPYKDSLESPVLVLGDSFLRIFQLDEPKNAGFIAHLARALQMPVSSIVNDGGASTLVRQELRRKPELLKNKKLVIWEFVERDLRFGTDGWQIVELPS